MNTLERISSTHEMVHDLLAYCLYLQQSIHGDITLCILEEVIGRTRAIDDSLNGVISSISATMKNV